MVSHRRDWDLQVAVAQSIVRFTVETQVPYALLPVDSASIDNFRKVSRTLAADDASDTDQHLSR